MSQIKLEAKADSKNIPKNSDGSNRTQVVDFDNSTGLLNGTKADLWSDLIELNGSQDNWTASWKPAGAGIGAELNIAEIVY